ncbi:hypothetical protein LSAT2_024558 [Lamellibrachia satsuma]|nr:hypothetical protein LSAT2_024558 [Lamellibrachia satsuma]
MSLFDAYAEKIGTFAIALTRHNVRWDVINNSGNMERQIYRRPSLLFNMANHIEALNGNTESPGELFKDTIKARFERQVGNFYGDFARF